MAHAQSVTEAAPWWGVPLIAGLFTILGVAAAHVGTWMLDKRRARREREQRWHTDRRTIYAAFMAAGQTVFGKVWENWDTGLDRSTVRELTDQIGLRRQEIQLIASAEVAEAAEKLFESVLDVAAAISDPHRSESTRKHLWDELHESRANLVAAARRELGIEA